MNELVTTANASIYNQVYPLQKPDYAKDVTEVSHKSYVAVLLTSSTGTNTESALLISLWRDLARKFGDVKFCQIRANLCIEGYPDRNTPTVLIYKDGDIKKQLVTLREINGDRTTLEDLERVLVAVGAIKLNDSRLKRASDEEKSRDRGSIRDKIQQDDDDDSDWD